MAVRIILSAILAVFAVIDIKEHRVRNSMLPYAALLCAVSGAVVGGVISVLSGAAVGAVITLIL